MSDMKCPICGKQMKIGTLDIDDSMGTVWMSIMPHDCVCSYGASKAVWQELIRTRKALEIAKDKLDTVRQYHRGTAVIRPDDIATYCDRAIEQITALEQKDVK